MFLIIIISEINLNIYLLIYADYAIIASNMASQQVLKMPLVYVILIFNLYLRPVPLFHDHRFIEDV